MSVNIPPSAFKSSKLPPGLPATCLQIKYTRQRPKRSEQWRYQYASVRQTGRRLCVPGVLILCLWLVGLSSARAQGINNPLLAANASKPVMVRVQYLVDSTDQLSVGPRSVGQLTSRPLHWQSTTNPNVVLGFTTHPVWCRFTVQQATPALRAYALELTNFYVDNLTLYQPDSLTGWRIQQAGDLIPFAQRMPQTRYPTLYVSLSGTAPLTFYARILSTQHHSYGWRMWDKAVFDRSRLPDTDRYVVFTLVFMLALFMLALLLFMHRFVVLRSYALWGLAVCISVLFASGYSSILFPQSAYWAHVSHYVTVGLLLPALAYYVAQACQLPRHAPRLVWLYIGFGAAGLAYAGLSFFLRHAYITWALMGLMAVLMGFSLILLIVLFLIGRRPVIWNVLALLLLLPIYTYFYGRNAGFFSGSLQEESLKFMMLISSVTEPFFVVVMLWQATRERIQTADRLSHEQRQRETMQALDTLKTDFFTNASHELRTPVTLLLGPLHTLHSRFPDNELYALMHRNARRLQTLINQLLDLAKLDARQLKNAPEPGMLTDDLRVWVAQFDSLAQSRSVTLTLDQNQPHWPALYDADKVEKILTNLLSNALKHTPAGGSVEVEAVYTPSGVTIEVRDTGVGMAAEMLPHLFDRFYQGNGANRLEAGTGVGLALTRELVHLLGGALTVRSQPGAGSTFRVSLPIQPGPIPSPPDRDEYPANPLTSRGLVNGALLMPPTDGFANAVLDPDEPATPTGRPLLLLVEDNDDIRIYIRMMLAPHYTLLEAADGQQGLEIALHHLPELIVTDLMMPRLDGLELCRALRADSRTDHIPLVMLTAKATVEDRLAGLEVGADDYLAKPFLPAELLVRLQNMRRRQETQRAYWQRTLASPVVEFGLPADIANAPPPPPAFLTQLYNTLEQYLDQPDFDVEQLADALAMSSRTLNRKLNSMLDLTTREIIRNYRLRRGSELLAEGLQPTQVAYAVGFGSLSSFGRAYKEQYGYAPSTHKGP